MITRFLRIAAAALVPVVGGVLVWMAAWAPDGSSAVPAAAPPFPGLVSQLELSRTQTGQIEEISAREGPRVRRLEQAFAESADELRRAELALPFDETLVATLVGRQAELAAHLRGTESRVVSRIVGVLTPEQRRRFAELRLGRLAEPISPSSLQRTGAPDS